MKPLVLANIRNGLVYPHDDTCYFQSCYGHQMKTGYCRIDSMPHRAIIHLLKGGTIKIVDATSNVKKLTDAQKFGVATWCLIFNRAIRAYGVEVCKWQTKHMREVIYHPKFRNKHKKLVKVIRKLISVYGYTKPAIIGDNVHLKCYQKVHFDDNSESIRDLIKCDWCNSFDTHVVGEFYAGDVMLCNDCGHEWQIVRSRRIYEINNGDY